jgi:hypothetical protein
VFIPAGTTVEPELFMLQQKEFRPYIVFPQTSSGDSTSYSAGI